METTSTTTTTITYFPKVAKYDMKPCQFCGELSDILSKSRDGKWVTTCQTCFGEKQGVVPVVSRTGSVRRFAEATSAGNGCKGTSTVFRCLKCDVEVAYVKSNKGKWYLADVYESQANWHGDGDGEARWIANWSAHYSTCNKEVK